MYWICLCSSLFFFLACISSIIKYSQNTIQAANGILALSRKNFKSHRCALRYPAGHFILTRFLTPEEIRDESHYMRYLSIGEQTNFSSPAIPSPMAAGLIR